MDFPQVGCFLSPGESTPWPQAKWKAVLRECSTPDCPEVDAGPDKTSLEGDLVILNAVVHDPDEELSPSFVWQVPASNGQVISSGTNPSFNFTPIDNGIYTVKVTVTDSPS